MLATVAWLLYLVSRIQLPPSGALPDPMQAPARAFDSSQELLWTGDELGRVRSFYGLDGTRYTSYKAGQDPIRQFLFHDKGSRRHERFTITRLLRDFAEYFLSLQVPTSDHFKIMKRSRYICAATPTGSVHILDNTNFSVVKIWQAHTALINDMDAQSDYIVTCGYSLPHQGSYRLDTFVLVLNLRTLTTLAPIPFPPGAAFVRMHPRMLTTSYIVSQQGQIHIVDLINPNSSNVRQANVLTTLRSLEIASSGEAIALSDMENNVHIWGSPGRIRFAEFSNPVELADSDEKPIRTDWTDDTPLSTIGMPYYRENLLSSWPSHMIFEVGAPPVKVESSFISTPKAFDGYICGRNARRDVRRNQIENTRTTEKTPASIQAPKFLSEKAREAVNDATPERGLNDIVDTIGNKELPTLQAGTNALYMNVEIKYSKFGVDDFDFGFYNKTSYSGLETHISNSYANALLQVMRFTNLIRNLALQHAATNCVSDMCLLCEMGFLFDMLEKAAGTVFSTPATMIIKCLYCKSEHTRPGATSSVDLTYPQTPPKSYNRSGKTPIPKRSFSEILKASIERETTNRGWFSHSAPIAPAESQWFLFNDFLVAPMPKEDALSFNSSWKLPSVITYQVKDQNNRVDNSWKQNLDTSLLYADENPRVIDRTHKPLSPTRETPTEGTLIALDTEFVSIRQPEIEVNSEGERQTIRPIAHALARVSVVRGSGEDEGLPFIDDYINCKDTIVDYLTSYSGIRPGDLDPRQSKHNLVSLKIAYKKLWILLNLGCKFVGHGLKTDFRVINIQIPKSHVIDTADLYFKPSKQRKLGLAYLAWSVFREDIQVETHDSIEDARTALRLWKKWEEWVAVEELGGATVEDLLTEVYRSGHASNYRPPSFNARKEREKGRERDGKDISRANTPPGSNEDGGASLKGPSTPVRKPFVALPFGSGGSGSANGSGFSSFGGGGGGWTPGKGSPLR
ncbi:poly(A)-specific ribonuclease [Ciborinia camelliae]|nr:poly(A)-specific ribonuclease [Ciborinia camelliae]